ncbi:MAG TPA: hypothetical protein VF815_12030 [Myxococcaceae bacterium]|jgi:hypothetical protein
MVLTLSGQTVALRSDKPFVTSRESARIELRVLDDTGRPLRGARLSLSVNVGSVSEPVASRDGVLTATYRAPSQEGPQVALFHAVVKSGAQAGTVGWFSLPVHGKQLLRVQAPARAKVRVSIDGVSFGPVVAGADGTASVPVEVPPGITSAQVTTVDRSGRSSTQELPLPGAQFARVRVVVPSEAPSWEKPIRLQGFVVDERGNPASALPPVAVSVDQGTLGPIEPKDGSTFEVLYTGPERVETPVILSVATAADAERPSTVQLEPKPGPLTRLAVTFSSPHFTAGSTEPITVEAVGYDAKGNPLPAPPATFTADLGSLDAESGGRRARILPPNAFGAKKAVALRVQAGDLQGQAELRLQGGTPVRGEAVVEPAPSKDGELVVVGHFVDEWGNPVDGLQVVGSSPGGTLRGPEALGDGRYRFYFSPASGQSGGTASFQLQAEGHPVVASGTLEVPSHGRPWQPTVGLLAFAQSNTALSNGLGIRAEGSLRLANLPLEALLQLEFRQNLRQTQRISPSGAPLVESAFTLRGFSARLGARWSQPFLSRGLLFADASAGLLSMSGEVQLVNVENAPEQDLRSNGVVLAVGGGLGWSLGRGRLIGAVQWAQAPGQGKVRGNLGGLSLGVGYQLPLSGGAGP